MDKKFIFKSPIFLIPFLTLTLIILAVLIYISNNTNAGGLTWFDKLYTAKVTDSVGSPTVISSYDDFNSGSGSSGSGSDGKNIAVDQPIVVPSDGGANSIKDQKLVKTGSISITVDDFDKSTDKVREIATSVNGLITNSTDTGKDNDRVVNISLKVPAKDFDSVMKKLKAIGVIVVTSSENSSDVTQTYMDLKARLKNQKALEAQLIKILDKALKVSDILEVQQQLSNVQGEIEVLQSQIKYYDSQIDMSTITVAMKLNTESLSVVDNTWKPLGTFRTALQSLLAVFIAIADLAIWLLVFSPIVIVPILGYRFIMKARKETKK